MYSFLSKFHNSVLNQIDDVQGYLELDFNDDEHYQFFLEQFGGLETLEEKHGVHFVRKLEQLRDTPLLRTSTLREDGYHQGPEDRMAIQNMIFQPVVSLQDNKVGSVSNSDKGLTAAEIIAEYTEKKSRIGVSTVLYDVTNGVQLRSVAQSVSDSYNFNGVIEADYASYFEDKPREFLITSSFYCTNSEEDSAELRSLKGYVTKSVAFTLKGNDEIIKSFKLNAPVISEAHRNDPNHTQVKIAYRREGAIPDYDYSNDDEPFIDGDNKKILVRVPFSVTVEAQKGWWISGFDKKYGYRMWIKNMVNGIINHYCNYDDIVQKQEEFDEEHRCTKMTFIFPDNWRNILDYSTVGYQAYDSVDFYNSFAILMSSKELTMPVSVSVKSDGKDYDLLNIKSAKLFIQWGCIARDTEIVMADGTIKRADEISIGEYVRSADGDSVQVLKVLSGYESELFKVCTANRFVRMTHDHPVATEHGIQPASDLQPGMLIKTIDGLEQVTAADWCEYRNKVYNFEFEKETLIIGNGMIIGDSLLQGKMLQSKVKELTVNEA